MHHFKNFDGNEESRLANGTRRQMERPKRIYGKVFVSAKKSIGVRLLSKCTKVMEWLELMFTTPCLAGLI